ncbi:gp459 [Bacillus phage G]|uniref:Gp459 n=1 Tax=Bacillus phage G TaxID=2884420 RepID=G3MAK0_9CAUD|nr:gp459 [Bacillus phage G]AEO93717.1 gp459 [Bacillus phage G]
MINIGGIDIHTDKMKERRLREIIDMCDSITLIRIREINCLLQHKMIARKNDYSIEFTLSTNLQNDLIVIHCDGFNSSSAKVLIYILEKIYLSQNKELQEKLNIINCENKKCPICNSEMSSKILANGLEKLICNNSCFRAANFKEKSMKFSCNVYEKHLHVNLIDSTESIAFKEQKINEVYNLINYWKEHDRYLIRVLSQEVKM